MNRFTKSMLIVAALICSVGILIGIYTISIVWRVSVTENECMGRSMLIPVRLDYPRFVEPMVPGSYGERTYRWHSHGREIVVWKQKINGLQHMFGSALADLELGDWGADKLFCANEFAEAFCDWSGIEPQDFLDRKKDLYINRLGREIGREARHRGLYGSEATAFITDRCMDTIETDPRFLGHYLDPRVAKLNERALGCPYLPKRNLFNRLKKLFGLG